MKDDKISQNFVLNQIIIWQKFEDGYKIILWAWSEKKVELFLIDILLLHWKSWDGLLNDFVAPSEAQSFNFRLCCSIKEKDNQLSIFGITERIHYS